MDYIAGCECAHVIIDDKSRACNAEGASDNLRRLITLR